MIVQYQFYCIESVN